MTEKAIELLNEFVEREKKRSRIGSGDDRFYEEQIENYVNEQKQFWIDYTKYLVGIKDKKKRRLKNE